MPEVQPTVDNQEMACAEIPGQPYGLVVFGASGDLARRKLFGSLHDLYERGLLSDKFYLMGCGRTQFSDEEFRSVVRESVEKTAQNRDVSEKFLTRMFYLSGQYDDPKFYEDIKARLKELDGKYAVGGCHIFYLSVPPKIYADVAEHLGQAGLSKPISCECPGQPRLVIEKPFGHDLETARELNRRIGEHFHESQVYRIDHYLGKETVQNILMFRFANTIFEPVWNRNYVDHVQITIAESLGIGHRAGYYESAGAVRDMFQNHMLGMLALVAMEPPASFEADHIRDEKVKLLKCIRPLEDENIDSAVIRGQYAAGEVEGEDVVGYRQEEGVAEDSRTDTYVAAKLLVDNWRWKGVPFYLRTGKRLPARLTEVAITFKTVPHSMFAAVGLDELPANTIVLKIQPDEGIKLSFQAKRPGSKVCMTTLNMNFDYAKVFGSGAPEAYQRLLLDSMVGDQTLFTRQDDVELSWKLLDPVIKMADSGAGELYEYAAGTAGPESADRLIEADGRKWRPLMS
ncbi:Glucose-6-phosphate 1-dehydrogenase [Anaerohalosphaera lusitana]|uniref:Glucose-6-phosphate 1-dehydrogenase n=1 Tax=Anaerohalosphaera lusitana TaxID=1936003 RepID=A0A1U9NP20_9BACT|nr:glucose-6-phosphate dehydrogenase [Anaerohalosphaera lusitana]AQT69484.1 Glucose-6-phosphate 1-dehydrogenase [Anaerohalosphaera lusitana]